MKPTYQSNLTSRPSFKKAIFISLLILNSLILSCGNEKSVDYTPQTSAESEAASPPYEYIISLLSDAVGPTVTNANAGGTEPANNVTRAYIDMRRLSYIRAHFASSLTSTLILCRIEYSLDNGASWAILVPNFAAGSTANQLNISSWSTIPTTAQAEVLLRAMVSGNGVLDPVIRYIRLGYY